MRSRRLAGRLSVQEPELSQGEEHVPDRPWLATMVRWSAAIAASGARRRPRRDRARRARCGSARLGSPVVMALRPRSRWTNREIDPGRSHRPRARGQGQTQDNEQRRAPSDAVGSSLRTCDARLLHQRSIRLILDPWIPEPAMSPLIEEHRVDVGSRVVVVSAFAAPASRTTMLGPTPSSNPPVFSRYLSADRHEEERIPEL